MIMGGSGMLGHKLWQILGQKHNAWRTLRDDLTQHHASVVFSDAKSIGGISVQDFDSVVRSFNEARPEVVVNCVGIVKQQAAAKDPLQCTEVNSVFPHRLAGLCRAVGARLIHISTDCVFSGRKGNYVETDNTDAEDLYGRSKLQGETTGPGCLTIRTSIIGRELTSSYGLVEWFLAQEGKPIKGYKKAIFSGFTTIALSRIIGSIIENNPKLEGLYHISADPISKYDLLELIKQTYSRQITIVPDSAFCCDRSLDSGRFRAATGFVPPSWPRMIEEMFQDPTPYDQIRNNYACR